MEKIQPDASIDALSYFYVGRWGLSSFTIDFPYLARGCEFV
jgi:hypothetical protein